MSICCRSLDCWRVDTRVGGTPCGIDNAVDIYRPSDGDFSFRFLHPSNVLGVALQFEIPNARGEQRNP